MALCRLWALCDKVCGVHAASQVYVASDDAWAYETLRDLVPDSVTLYWNTEADRAFLAVRKRERQSEFAG